jgi:hypothetical protein
MHADHPNFIDPISKSRQSQVTAAYDELLNDNPGFLVPAVLTSENNILGNAPGRKIGALKMLYVNFLRRALFKSRRNGLSSEGPLQNQQYDCGNDYESG